MVKKCLAVFVVLVGLLGLQLQLVMAQDDAISRICMVLNIGRVDDGTFNEVSYSGLLDIRRDYDLSPEDTIYLESNGPQDWASNIQTCINDGFDVVVTVGFLLGEDTLAAAQNNPDIYFIGIDQYLEDGPQNYVGIQFRDDEAGFLMGYLAGLVTESGTVAGIYGPRIPVIKRFRHGFEEGVRLAAQVTGQNITALGRYLSGFDNADEGIAYSQEVIGRGADVVFNAAGVTGSEGILYAAAQDVYVIGVDQDEYFTSFGGGTAPGASFIISSALKRVNIGVYDMVSALLEGNLDAFPGGSIYVLSLENGGISFANPHESDVPQEIYDQVIAIGGDLAFGGLTTGVNPVTGDLIAMEEPATITEMWLTAALVDIDVQTVSALTCAANAANIVLDEAEAQAVIATNPRLDDLACTFDGETTVTCAGNWVRDGLEPVSLGTFNVAQEGDNWTVCD